MQHSNTTITGQEITLGPEEYHFLGPQLVLEGCTLSLRTSGKHISFNTATIRNSAVAAKKQVKNLNATHARFESCTFTGTFVGCDFGHRPPPPESFNSDFGRIHGCDFSASILHQCRFFGCDLTTIRLPTDPHLLIHSKPRVNRAHVPSALAAISEISFIFDYEFLPHQVLAIQSVPHLLKSAKISFDELASAMKAADGVEITGGPTGSTTAIRRKIR